MNKNIDIYKNNTSNKNKEKDLLEKNICIIENKIEIILSQIKEIDIKISKLDKDEVNLKKKDDAMKAILLKEKKKYDIENIIQVEIIQKNKKGYNEEANNNNVQNEKQVNKYIRLKNNKEIINTEISDRIICSNENEENKVLEEDIELTNRLKQFFYNENGELNKAEVSFNELEEMELFYKSLLEKNKNIEDIEEYQNNYIELAINPQLKLLKRDRIKQAVKGRKEKLKNRLDKLKKGE